jgi:hypothetical protein
MDLCRAIWVLVALAVFAFAEEPVRQDGYAAVKSGAGSCAIVKGL